MVISPVICGAIRVRLGVQFFLGWADVLTADFVEDADCNTGSNVERWRGVTSLVS
jgi:hypothetical protein